MAKRQKSEIYPTLKVNPKPTDENAVKFDAEMQVTIKKVVDAETKYGDKLIAHVEANDGKMYSVFVNATSKNKLIDAFGDDDDKWIGKLCDLRKEDSKGFDNEQITFYPIA